MKYQLNYARCYVQIRDLNFNRRQNW